MRVCVCLFERKLASKMYASNVEPKTKSANTKNTKLHATPCRSELVAHSPSAELHMVSLGRYLSVSRMITSICSSVSCTASLCCASHGTYAAQNYSSSRSGEFVEVSVHKVRGTDTNAILCINAFIRPPTRTLGLRRGHSTRICGGGLGCIGVNVPVWTLCPFSGDTNRCGSNCCATTAARWSDSRRNCARATWRARCGLRVGIWWWKT